MKYSSSFTHDLNFGEKGEDWINEIFKDGKLIEVKSDRLAHKTGNVYIEYECRGKPSGIATTKFNSKDIEYIQQSPQPNINDTLKFVPGMRGADF